MEVEWRDASRARAKAPPLPRRAPTTAPARPATTITITDTGGCNRSEEEGLKAAKLQDPDMPLFPEILRPRGIMGDPSHSHPSSYHHDPCRTRSPGYFVAGHEWGRGGRKRQHRRSGAGEARREVCLPLAHDQQMGESLLGAQILFC